MSIESEPNNGFNRRLNWSVALINMLIVGLAALFLCYSYNNYRTSAETTTQNLARLLSQAIGNIFDRVDLGLQVTVEEIQRQTADGHPNSEALSAFMQRMQQRLPWVIGLRATDADGWLTSGTDLPKQQLLTAADRDYFIRHRNAANLGLFIDQPVISRVNKVWVIHLARRINASDGRFAGVVFANIALQDIGELFNLIDVGRLGAINLRDQGLNLIMRHSVNENIGDLIGKKDVSVEFQQAFDKGLGIGSFHTPLSFDGVARTVSFRKIENQPLIISVGLADEEVFAQWWAEVWQMSGLVALFMLISISGGRLLKRAWNRQLNMLENLAREEEKFHTVADHTYDWEYWEAPEHSIIYMSLSCQRVTGYTPDDFLANPDLLSTIVHADDRDAFRRHCHDAAHGRADEIDFRITRKNGEVRWISHCCQAVFDRNKAYIGHRVSNRDMTERRLFENEINRLAQAADQNPTGILITDPQGKLTYANIAYSRITGYSFGEVYGRPHRELIASEMTEAEFADCQRRVLAGKLWEKALQNRHQNGELAWEQIIASPIFDSEFNICNYLYLRTDISDRKRKDEELRRYKDHLEDEIQQRTAEMVVARNAAEAANLAKSVFLANMSHELRTPLNAILGFSSMMGKNQQLNDDQRQQLDIIRRSGEHLLTLINDVLEMAKIEAGRVKLENAAFDLGSMVRDVTDMMGMRAQEKGLRLLLDQSSEFPRFIFGDEARLRQVLINLVGNAIKFTEEGGVTVRLGVKGNACSHLLIEVEDSGSGIAPDDCARIFEPFVQLGKQQNNNGTGLGLTITRQFVQLMGGRLDLESVLGKGTLFRIDLPLTEAGIADLPEQETPTRGDVLGLEPGQVPYRILIVEDQLENQLLLVKLMETLGLPVKVAENGEQGIRLFQAWQPHLIWMDKQMPVMSGVEATQHIRALPGGDKVKIVAVTASAFKEQRSELLAAGMDDFVRKPYRFSEIYECLAAQLGLRYIYEGCEEVAPQQKVITAAMLSVLPVVIRQALKSALESLETDNIERVLDQIAAYDPVLQKRLRYLAENFEYPAILKALPEDQE